MSESIKPNKDVESNKLSDSGFLENVLTNLKILSNIRPNDKLSNDNEGTLIIDKPYMFQGAVRWWYSDSRDNTVEHLEKIIQDTFKIIDQVYSSEITQNNGSDIENNYYYKHSLPNNYFKSENSAQLQRFSNELNNTIKGLENLKITYKNDIKICSRVDVIVEKINIRIKKINGLLTINTNNSN